MTYQPHWQTYSVSSWDTVHTYTSLSLFLSFCLVLSTFHEKRGGKQRKNGGGFCSRWKLRNTGPGIMATAEIIVSRTASSVFNRAFRLCFGCLIFRIAIRGFAGGRNNVRHSWSERSNALSLSLSRRDRSMDFVYYSRNGGGFICGGCSNEESCNLGFREFPGNYDRSR